MDSRVEFTNYIVNLILIKNGMDFNKSIPELKQLIKYCKDVIRNFYEIYTVDYDVPVLTWLHIKDQSHDDFCMSEYEFELLKKAIINSCKINHTGIIL